VRRVGIAVCVPLIALIGCRPAAVDPVENANTTQSKAEILEQNAAAGGRAAAPSASQIIKTEEVQAVDPDGTEPLDDAITCLARTIYWEARGEGAPAMEAVATVVMNRLGHAGFPNTVCAVVMQGREQGSCQFSWWCDGRPDDAKDDESYAMAKEIAREALNRQLMDRTGGALYFHQRRSVPPWAINTSGPLTSLGSSSTSPAKGRHNEDAIATPRGAKCSYL